jgi:hypothetical protein
MLAVHLHHARTGPVLCQRYLCDPVGSVALHRLRQPPELTIHRLTLQFSIQRKLRSRHYDGIVIPSFLPQPPADEAFRRVRAPSPLIDCHQGIWAQGARPIRIGSGRHHPVRCLPLAPPNCPVPESCRSPASHLHRGKTTAGTSGTESYGTK